MEIALITKCHIDVGIDTASGAISRAYRDENAVLITSVDKMMSIRHACRPRRDITCPQNRLAAIFYQHRRTRQYDDELIFSMMPVPVRGPAAGL